MKFKSVFVLVCCSVLVTESRLITKDTPTEGKEVIETVPKPERPTFLAYTLGHGFMEQYRMESSRSFPFPTLLRLPTRLEKKFEELDKPKNFTSDLYLFVQTTFRLSSTEMFALILRKRYCFPHGKCIDLENIGELCCPF